MFPQMTLVGNVKDKCAILVDDMAGTQVSPHLSLPAPSHELD